MISPAVKDKAWASFELSFGPGFVNTDALMREEFFLCPCFLEAAKRLVETNPTQARTAKYFILLISFPPFIPIHLFSIYLYPT
jgi:hypothetical protein